MMTSHGPDDVQHLAEWLADRRWYGDKARTITGAETVFRGRSSDDAGIALDVLRLSYESGPPADYLLVRDSRNDSEDGIESERVRQWLLAGFEDGRVLEGEGGARMRWKTTTDIGAWGLSTETPSHVFRGEQSNSSIVYGNSAMMKVFRRLRSGMNPEVEIGEFLTRHTDFEAFPRLLATIDLESGDKRTTLAAVQEFISSVGDAWGWILERINEPADRPATVDAAGVLGVRTGGMHIAFASGESPAFAPEIASAAYAEAVHGESRTELRDTIDQLERRGVGGATQLGTALEGTLDAMLKLEGTMITRIHGDYHLGQVLRTENGDFAVLDFEGEPSRSLAERRAKASPLRDVAGMLRSFDYAAESARRSSGSSETPEIDRWYADCRSAFLDGYDSTVRLNDVLMQGWDEQSRSAVLAALEMHKALYEVRYELSNRPDWLEIPLNALRRIADTAPMD